MTMGYENNMNETMKRDESDNSARLSSPVMTILKLAASLLFLWSAYCTIYSSSKTHRRLTQEIIVDSVPTYMSKLFDDLKERKKLMEDTPPDEVKYWFEYPGPLQVSKFYV